MSLVEWNENYSLHIEEIDNQHKTLLQMLNKLHAALKEGKAKEILGNIIDELVDYTKFHFSTEEKYFEMYDYPETDAHKAEHRDLVEQVADFQNKFNSGETVLSIDVMNFLRDWVHDHIVGSDAKFGPYLISKGL